MSELRPVDGEYVHSAEARRVLCVESGHPMVLVNISLSKPGAEIRRCVCGEVDQAPKARKRNGK